jgi:hypothetical protein
MRAKGKKYLPSYDSEDSKRYRFRKNRTYLFEAYKDTLDRLESKAFTKDVRVENIPSELEYLIVDANGQGQSLTQLAKDVLRNSVQKGIDFIFVDYPSVEGVENRAQENNIRPTINRIDATKLFWWDTINQGGQTELDNIRFYENIRVPDKDGFGEIEIEQIKRYFRDSWEVWQKAEKEEEEWKLVEQGPHSFDGVPIIPVYGDYAGFMEGIPPLMKLAWKNIEHYQICSDLNWVLYYATGVWWLAGATEEEIKKGLAVGPGAFKGSTNPDAKLEHIEPKGKSVEALIKRKKEIEEEMASLGAEPFMSLRVNVKATGQIQDQEKANSDIGAWVRNVEEKLKKAIEYAGKWKGIDVGDDLEVEIVFDPTVGAGVDDMIHVQNYKSAGAISKETYIKEGQRRGILSETIDPEEESAKAEIEAPSLSSIRGVQE